MTDAPDRIRVSVDFAKATLNFPEGPKNRTLQEYVRADRVSQYRKALEVVRGSPHGSNCPGFGARLDNFNCVCHVAVARDALDGRMDIDDD
ncbi:MAG: hypothetical protein OXC11_11065 [Rhodospirillales bacterium]|nr:hypothetical protein [Rhodospirillales bacterium]